MATSVFKDDPRCPGGEFAGRRQKNFLYIPYAANTDHKLKATH